jgi:hypothetical protein
MIKPVDSIVMNLLLLFLCCQVGPDAIFVEFYDHVSVRPRIMRLEEALKIKFL